ncbi:hypothetical protein MES4922_110005 [Mesorhizobium ventifaucium]|uniref:Uncharacterized protein n=1 Tax=Mesorhizobium ventifaucium TaxID=666020 RepID=A0ABM9DDD8_9HYPH|nr:hypothetical protein MES4922_110005 [Mesorhizobium ventifaucium]
MIEAGNRSGVDIWCDVIGCFIQPYPQLRLTHPGQSNSIEAHWAEELSPAWWETRHRSYQRSASLSPYRMRRATYFPLLSLKPTGNPYDMLRSL